MAARFPSGRRLLIVNTSVDTCEMLEEYFRARGWHAVSVFTRDLRIGTTTPAALVAAHAPDVMLVDVAVPYEANWTMVQRLRADPAVSCRIVLTTTNEAAVRRLVGTQERLQEIVGKPYDLNLLHDAVVRASEGEAFRIPAPEAERRTGERRVKERRGSSGNRPDATEDPPR